ncbi:MAG: hypothetical protein N3D73_01680 [Candidatus Diapherotrites archaeon]|nr:hypothetical protein [Candidatus Diapherotrites archaeon]
MKEITEILVESYKKSLSPINIIKVVGIFAIIYLISIVLALVPIVGPILSLLTMFFGIAVTYIVGANIAYEKNKFEINRAVQRYVTFVLANLFLAIISAVIAIILILAGIGTIIGSVATFGFTTQTLQSLILPLIVVFIIALIISVVITPIAWLLATLSLFEDINIAEVITKAFSLGFKDLLKNAAYIIGTGLLTLIPGVLIGIIIFLGIQNFLLLIIGMILLIIWILQATTFNIIATVNFYRYKIESAKK